MLYTKADGSGGVTNTAQPGWVPIKGTDNMTSGAQIGYKPATYVPGTSTVAAPASWTTPGTNTTVTSNQALAQGLLLVPKAAAPAAPAAPAAAPAAPGAAPAEPKKAPNPAPVTKDGTQLEPEGTEHPEQAADNEGNVNNSDNQHPDSANFDVEEMAESGQITQEQADAASMENLEKYVNFGGGSEEDRREFMEAFQKFVLMGYLYGRDVLGEIANNGSGGQLNITYGGAGGYDGMSNTLGGDQGVDFAPGYGNSGGGSEDWLVFHELGHEILGLQHSPPTGGSGKSNVMNYYSAGDFKNDPRHWGGELFAEANWGDPTKWGQQTPATAPPRDIDPKTYGNYDPKRDEAADEGTRKAAGPGTGPVPDAPAPQPEGPKPENTTEEAPQTSPTPTNTSPHPRTQQPVEVQPIGQIQPIGTAPMIGVGMPAHPMAGSQGGDFDPAQFGAVSLDSRGRGDDSPELPDPDDTGDAARAPNPGSSLGGEERDYFRSALAENLKRAPSFARGGVLARR